MTSPPIGERRPTAAWKDVLAFLQLTHSREDCKRSVRERHPMFPMTFHSGRGNDPEFTIKIHLLPLGAKHFPGSGRGQNQELQGASRHPGRCRNSGMKLGISA